MQEIHQVPSSHTVARTRMSRRQGGWGTIDLLISLVVTATVLTASGVAVNEYIAAQRDAGAANDLKVVASAAQQWLDDNGATVLAAANPTSIYPVATFAASLPASFSANSNIYNQTYSLRVYKSGANQLDAVVVTTGGQAISEGSMKRIANRLGGPGGYIPTAAPSQAQGTSGAWAINWANFGGTPGAGHVAMALFVQNASASNGYLYRVAVAGHPELNTMSTDLNMGTKNVVNAGKINGAELNVTGNANVSGNTVTTGETYTGGWFRTRGNTGWYNEAYNGGWYMSDTTWVRSYADKNVYTGGEMQATTLRANSRVITGDLAINAIGAVGGGCAVGTFARDASGKMLSCVYGAWSAGGISSVTTVSSGWAQNGASVQCPAGTTVVGGSCGMERGGDGRVVGAQICYPNGNGWACSEGNTGNCIAYAQCAS
ncbi:shufflon system plasmid conjugative transfer pilus tip adhesin PilV [Pandoraea cepalis]|nr:shufflon system plasmid conjugative transfer pilus tip adhesin PilV [Pandoraea cepalis]